MPHYAELDMKPMDFRQHYQAEPHKVPAGVRQVAVLSDPAAQVADQDHKEAHWLLSTFSGRDLLKSKLRQERPDLKVPKWNYGPHLDAELDAMIDVLDLRDMPQPRTLGERFSAMRTLLSMGLELDRAQRR